MMTSKRTTHMYGGVLAVVAIVAAALAGCGSSGGASATAETTSPAPVQGSYSPSIDPANFSSTVDNRYFPLTPGSVTRSNGVAEDGKTPQVDRSEVTRQDEDDPGVRHRRGPRHDQLNRDSRWSNTTGTPRTSRATCGTSGRLVDYKYGHFVKNTGSWQAGVDGAQPGIIMEANPKPGDAYRQDSTHPGHALDQAEVLSTTGAVHVPYKSFPRTLGRTPSTRPWSPTSRREKW